jgi:hypothetical protein
MLGFLTLGTDSNLQTLSVKYNDHKQDTSHDVDSSTYFSKNKIKQYWPNPSLIEMINFQ